MRVLLQKIFQFALISALAIAWIFSGWPAVWQNPRIPPEIQEALANTTTVYATSNSADGSLTGWTNPTYAYTDDGTNFTTRAGTVKNTWYGTLYGFDLSGIPDGSTINSVTITAEWKNSAADTNGPVLYLGAQSGGAEVGTATSDTSGQTTFELVTKSPAGLTAANLKATGASGFWAILRFRRTDNSTHTASVDYVKVAVDYTPIVAPTVSTQAAGSVEATTATGNGTIDATGGENANAWGVCYKTSSPCTTADSTAAGSGSGGTGAFTASMTSLSSGTTYYIKAYATNSAGTGYGSEVQILTKPAAPTSVAATDGTYTDKVTITWTKSSGATDYHVWRDAVDLGAAGDVATYDDTGAATPTITPGSAVASDGASTAQVDLSLSGASANNGTTHTYKVVASNTTGNSVDSATDTGYRGVGALTYQWQKSAADSDASYSDISGATSASYNDTGAPSDGSGRYFKVVLNATGATQQISTADRGYRLVTVYSVSITSSGSISYGLVDLSNSTTTLNHGYTQTVQNDGNTTEKLNVKSSDATGGTAWTLASSIGTNQFKHEFSTTTGSVWTVMPDSNTYVTAAPSVAQSGTASFDFRLTAPSASTDYQQKSITITVQAVAP
ncbi:MAG: hypothetical protein AAB470_00990 [Patescibacteria group bacterium]